jgi:hypothetical protein
MKNVGLSVALTLIAVNLSGCGGTLPLLLVGASAAGGYLGGCAQPNGAHSPLALSPRFNQRLAKQFPPGSPASKLEAELLAEGFELGGACPEDQTILTAHYLQKYYGLEQASAVVFWKTDASGDIVRTEGFLSFNGL